MHACVPLPKKYLEASRKFTKAAKKNPSDPTNFSYRAQCRIERGKFPEALEDAERCIELDPAFVMGYVCKGNALSLLGAYEDAVSTLIDGLKHGPGNPEILDGLKRYSAHLKMAKSNSNDDVRAENLRKHERDIEHLRNELQKSKIEASEERSSQRDYEYVVEQLTLQNDLLDQELQTANQRTGNLERQLEEHNALFQQLQPHFTCPISQDVMDEPVIAADGHTYEAEMIKDWFRRGRTTSPMTNEQLEHRELIPNHALRSAIEKWRQLQNMAP
uniref:U-box domain-containing protein n=1 Tax=Leersia perrieri TaxID=77586 RepID=A0A0D9WM63_9ORYZ